MGNVESQKCPCISKTCTPSEGPDAGKTKTYSKRGEATVINGKTLWWCFVDTTCPTGMVSNDWSCPGEKQPFAFIDNQANIDSLYHHTTPDWVRTNVLAVPDFTDYGIPFDQ